MTKILLSSYQNEYETTSITIEELCGKYSLSTGDLKGYTEWEKRVEDPPQHLQDLNNSVIPDLLLPQTTPQPSPTPKQKPVGLDNRDTVLAKVEVFKLKAMEKAEDFIEKYGQYGEVKELKDIVAIVDGIEKSYKTAKDTKPTINILVQNLVEKYKDDC